MKMLLKIFCCLIFLLLIFYVILSLNSKKNSEEISSTIISTQENIKKLDVPFLKQEYIRSCEEASLRMVLAFYGIKTNDIEIVKKAGYDPHPRDRENNIWDDPNEMFVGSIGDPNKNGYGAFAGAIAKAAKAFGRDAKSYTDISAQFIAEQIYAGYPIIIWGFTKPPLTKYYWNTRDGKKIIAYRGEHARVVVGVFGDQSNPTGFLINDPLTADGKEEYWSTEKLMTHINTLGNLTNQAVVVK